MSRKEKIRNIAGIVVSLVFLAVLWHVVAGSCIPRIFFWIAAELFIFADGVTVRNLIVFG